jgi:hypothetical protein
MGGMIGPRHFADHGEFGKIRASSDETDFACRASNAWWTPFNQRIRSRPLSLSLEPSKLLRLPALPEPAQRGGADDASQAQNGCPA